MPTSDIQFGNRALASLSEGVEFIAKIVGATFGPLGGYALIDQAGGAPQVTRTFAEVTADLGTKQRPQNVGVQMLLDIARPTEAGIAGGSATTALLAAAIVREGLRYIVSGHHPVAIKLALDRAAKAVSAELERVSRAIEVATFREAFNEIWIAEDRSIASFAEKAGVPRVPDALGKLIVQPDEYVPEELISEGTECGLTNAQLRTISEQISEARRAVRERVRERSPEPQINWALLTSVATGAADGRDALAHAVIRAFRRVGIHGHVTPEKGYGTEHEIVVSEGLKFGGALISPHFSTEEGRIVALLDDALVLVTDQDITEVHDLLHLLEAAVKSTRPLLIIANEVTGSALSVLVINKVRGNLRVAVVKPSGDAEQRAAIFQDAIVATGARFVSVGSGLSLKNATSADFGRARSIEASESQVVIVSHEDLLPNIHAHIESLKKRVEVSANPRAQARHRERIARVSQQLAQIGVGGRTVRETQDNLARCEEIVRAVRHAIDSGVVPGGGAALLRAAAATRYLDGGSADQRAAVMALVEALQLPIRKILERRGASAAEIIKSVASGNARTGYDAISGEIGPADEKSSADPVATIQRAVLAAASLAGVILMTDVLISQREDTG